MSNEPVSRITVIEHLSQIILNYIQINQDSESDVADARRQAENVAELILSSLQFEIIAGPTRDGKILALVEVIGPEDFIGI